MSEEEVLAGLERELAGAVKCDLDDGDGESEKAASIAHVTCPHCDAEWAMLVCRKHRTTLMMLRNTDAALDCGLCGLPVTVKTGFVIEKL